MKVVAIIVGTISLLGLLTVPDSIGKERGVMTSGIALATMLYTIGILLLCMRVMGWL